MDVCQALDRLWEVVVSPSPVVHNLRSSDTQAPSNLGSVNELVEIDLPSHDVTVTLGTDSLGGPCCVNIDARASLCVD